MFGDDDYVVFPTGNTPNFEALRPSKKVIETAKVEEKKCPKSFRKVKRAVAKKSQEKKKEAKKEAKTAEANSVTTKAPVATEPIMSPMQEPALSKAPVPAAAPEPRRRNLARYMTGRA